MSASRTRGLIGATTVVVVLGLTAACGNEDSSGVGAQPTPSTPATTPGTPPTLPTADPSGSPSMDCPETISAIRAAVDKAVWGKGAAKSQFQPVGVTICQYDAEATGKAYANVITKRTAKQATELFTLVNSAKPATSKPKFCTDDIGPTYVLRFTDNERGVLSYAVETFGCRRLVATSFEGQGKPGDLASPRHATPELIKSLGLR